MLEFINNLTGDRYIGAIIYFGIYLLVVGALVFIIKKIFVRLTLKTKTDLDDLIVKQMNKPIIYLLILTGLRFALERINGSNSLEIFLEILNSLIVLGGFYLIYIIFDLGFSRAWRRFARKTKRKPNDALIQLTDVTLKIILVTGALIYVLSLWGVEIGPLLAGVGIGGVAIAFALQNSLGNIFGGVSIILDKSIRVGDVITLEGGISGRVTHVGLRSTKITSWDNEYLIIPNSKLSESVIHNIAMPEPKSRVVIPFGVEYGSDIEKVKKIVINELKKVSGFVSEPSPVVRFLQMGNSSLDFKAYFFVESYEIRFAAIDEANTKIYNALNKAGIEIPFPQMDVHLKKK